MMIEHLAGEFAQWLTKKLNGKQLSKMGKERI